MKLNILFIKFFLVLILSGCNNFKRFEQKKYFCSENELNIELIDILETSSIKKSYLTIKEKEYLANIISLNSEEINIELNDIKININLNNNQITALNENKIFFLKCEKSKFNI